MLVLDGHLLAAVSQDFSQTNTPSRMTSPTAMAIGFENSTGTEPPTAPESSKSVMSNAPSFT